MPNYKYSYATQVCRVKWDYRAVKAVVWCASGNLRGVPISVIPHAKAAAALEGKTLRIFVIDAIQEKIRKVK
jgi:hypothetical protein